jgi:glycosyltransferase involved in cell wall biosynthesis
MSEIVFADDGIEFDGTTPDRRPLGGVENATVALAEALAARGHRVTVCNQCAAPLDHRGVRWQPLRDGGVPAAPDLYVANREHQLLLRAPLARRRVLWLHNPAGYIGERSYRWKLALARPTLVVLGAYHASTVPAWFPRRRVVTIPYGLSAAHLAVPPWPRGIPPVRRAIFTSNPARNLDWLLDVWTTRIRPRVPDAELHLFSGPEVYQMTRGSGYELMRRVLARAESFADAGVVRRQPVGRSALIEELMQSRAMLYRSHEQETFCLALADAQALGVPCVVQPIGSAPERVRDETTGTVAPDEAAFADAAVRLLTDDALWRRMHEAALGSQRTRTWDDAARDFEALLPPLSQRRSR